MVNPIDLAALLHRSLQKLPAPIKHNLLFRDTIVAWREIRKKLGISPHISNHLPIFGNPLFTPSLQYEPFSKWKDKGLVLVWSFFQDVTGNFKSFSQLSNEFLIPQKHFYSYTQYVDFLSKICPKKSIRLQSSFIDTLVANNKHSISDIYTPLIAKFSVPLQNTSMSSWTKDLPDLLTVEDIVRGYKITRAIIQCESWRETQFKIMHRAYYPFSTTGSPDIGPACPWCLSNKPTLLHRFWTCTPIVTFWSSVTHFITNVTLFHSVLDIKFLLFGCPPHAEPYSSAYNRLPRGTKHWILLTLLTARRTILQHWITPSPLQIHSWWKAWKPCC